MNIVYVISRVGRVVYTGSVMATFLTKNSYMLLAHARFVQLGGTLSASAASVMAVELGQACAIYLPERIRQFLDSGAIVTKLDSAARGEMLNPRPAMVAHALGLMGNAHAGSVDEMVAAAVESAVFRMRTKSRGDFSTALVYLETSPEIKQGLFELAHGNCRRLDDLSLKDVLPKMLSQLCEAISVDGIRQFTLIPPYASLIKECLNENGDVIVRWSRLGCEDELGEKLRGILNFFSEAYALRYFSGAQLARISEVVIESLRTNGIGVAIPNTGIVSAVRSASDVVKVPVLLSLLQNSANSTLAVEHTSMLSDRRVLLSYNASIGFHILRWARNVASYHSWAARVLATNGLSVSVLDAAARAAAAAVCTGDVRDQAASGSVFQLDKRGIPYRTPSADLQIRHRKY